MAYLSVTAAMSLVLLCTLGVMLWSTVGAAAPVAWVGAGVFSLMLPLLLKTLNERPTPTVAEILREVEAGKSR
jgi:hypothetical protein